LFILYCEHDAETSTSEPGYQVLCDLKASKDDYSTRLENNLPNLQVQQNDHLFNIPAFGEQLRVLHTDSIFDKLLEW
jgi:hypothetical protein